MMNGCAFEFPRWGSDTVMLAFPSSARKLAGTVAFRWRELTKVVASGRPLNSTVDWFVKSPPLTVSVKPELPSAAEVWLRLAICGVNAGVTVSPVNEKAPLKVGGGAPPTMSVPMRSQSGASGGSSRIQLCRAVEPGGKGVPGGTIGLGAESQRNCPVERSTWGTKK